MVWRDTDTDATDPGEVRWETDRFHGALRLTADDRWPQRRAPGSP